MYCTLTLREKLQVQNVNWLIDNPDTEPLRIEDGEAVFKFRYSTSEKLPALPTRQRWSSLKSEAA